MLTLYKHQVDIIQENKPKVGLFLGTGSAKTATALHLAQGSILCITPKLQKEEENFKREAKKWNLSKDITSLSKEQFKKAYSLGNLGRFDTVIIDEAHTVAGVTPNIRWVKGKRMAKSSQLFDSLIAYLKQYPPSRLYVLTATPTRSPMCVWGLAKILGYNYDFHKFREAFYIPIKRGFREFFIIKNDKETKKRLGRIVQHIGYTGQLSDYFDVPEQTYKDIHVSLTKEQEARIASLCVEFPDPLVLIGKKHQVENGVLTGDQFANPEVISDNKTQVLLDLALEFPKMVIFAKYTMQIDKIAGSLRLEGYQVFVLDGRTKNREKVLSDANTSFACIIIIQSQISAGFELPTFPVMVFASMSYSVVDRIQGEGRILRANALKKNLYITLTAKGGIDEAVTKSIENKVDFSEYIYAEKGSQLSDGIQ